MTSTSNRIPVVFVSGGRAFIRFDNGWLDLGPEAEVSRLDPRALAAVIRERASKPVWHEVPRRPM